MPESLARHTIAAACGEKVIRLSLEQYFHTRAVDEISEPALRFIAQWNQPFDIALANDAQNTLVEIDLRLLEID